MKSIVQKDPGRLYFKYLPSFTRYILENHLDEYVKELLQLSRKIEIPFLKYFSSLSEGELIELSKNSNSEFLKYISENKAFDQIEETKRTWINNRIPQIHRDNLVVEDITKVCYVRKLGFLKFLPEYTEDIKEALKIIKEIDRYILELEKTLSNTYSNLLKQKIEDRAQFISRITETSPGIIYVFDLVQQREIYSNEKLKDSLGYTHEELFEKGSNLLTELVHPDDLPGAMVHFKNFSTARDGEIRSFIYRIKDKAGNYRWMKNYESVFKRDENGKPLEIIGIGLNIDKEKVISSQLRLREEQLLEAQEIAVMGSFEWDLINIKGEQTPQFLKILELKKGDGLEQFLARIHPSDREKVKASIDKAIKEKSIYDAEFRYNTSVREKIIWSKGTVSEIDSTLIMKGTVMDVTNRYHIIQKLQRSEDLYKQAQALTHIGNYIWDLKSKKIKWSDELFRIYGMEPTEEPIEYQTIAAYNHPDDLEYVKSKTRTSIENHAQFDFLYRIILSDKSEKILRARGEILVDEITGEPYKVIGTAEDVTEKEELIRRLQESENLYKQAQTLAHIGNWSWDVEKNIVTWSDELFKIFDIEPGTPIDYDHYISLIYPDDIELVKTSIEKGLKNRKRYEFYHRIQWKDGSVRILHSRGEPLLNPQGEVYKLIGTAQDVTKEQQTERELREHQNFIQKIADATPSIITSYNIHTGHYRFVSGGLQKLLGYDPEQPMKEGVDFFMKIIHPEDIPIIMEKNARALEMANTQEPDTFNDLVLEFQYRMRHKNGQYRWIHTYGTVFDRDKDGRVEHVLNISLDVTEKMEAEKKIKEQERFIQNIADASPTILYLYDVNENKIVYVNQEINYVLGYTPEEIIGMKSNFRKKIYHPDDISILPKDKETYKELDNTNTMFQYECRMFHKNEETRWMLVREIVFTRDEAGLPLQILGAALDITDRKDMEKALFQKTMQLEQSNKSLEEFAYVASHDLQEPLRKISIFGDRLLVVQTEQLNAEAQVYLKKIINSSLRMQVLIDDLLTLSKISHDKSYQYINLQTILKEVLHTLEHKIEEKHAKIIADDLPDAKVIPSQFRQLFQNLISNSLKFVREQIDPVIEITWKYLEPREAEKFNVSKGKKYLQIIISDNGIGFENEYAERIFAIFQRLHGRSEYEGTGIGLAICKKIAENHGGCISATGVPEKGSTFTIIIPAAK